MLNDLNGALLNYSINYSGIEIDTVPRVIYLSNPTLTNQSIILTNLEEYTTYSINVSAYTKVGRGPDAVVSQRTNQDGEYFLVYFILAYLTLVIYNVSTLAPSGSPLNLTAFPVSATSILVEWTVPATYDQNGVITSFTVLSSLVGEEQKAIDRLIPVRDNSTKFCFLLNGLEEASTYEIEVRATTVVDGNGPSITVSASTFNAGLFSYVILSITVF